MSRSITAFLWPRCIYFPLRPNGQLLPFLPAPLSRTAMTRVLVAGSGLLGSFERRTAPRPRPSEGHRPRDATDHRHVELSKSRLTTRCAFPGWQPNGRNGRGQRPFVGTLTMELPTDADEEVASWIAAGTPPICFGFGSMAIDSAADTIAMISAACAQLGERALVCAGWSRFRRYPRRRSRQGGGHDELRGDLSGLPRGRAPRWRGHHDCGPAGRASPRWSSGLLPDRRCGELSSKE